VHLGLQQRRQIRDRGLLLADGFAGHLPKPGFHGRELQLGGVRARLAAGYRQAWLARLRAEDAQRAQQDVLAFKDQLQRITDERRQQLRPDTNA
jgi:hypothetical protein